MSEPFSDGDFAWAPANYAPSENILATKYFAPEIRFDESYHYSFAHPSDDTIGGSSEVFRANEFQSSEIGLCGEFKYKNVGFRIITQFGLYAEAISEAYASSISTVGCITTRAPDGRYQAIKAMSQTETATERHPVTANGFRLRRLS